MPATSTAKTTRAEPSAGHRHPGDREHRRAPIPRRWDTHPSLGGPARGRRARAAAPVQPRPRSRPTAPAYAWVQTNTSPWPASVNGASRQLTSAVACRRVPVPGVLRLDSPHAIRLPRSAASR